MDAVKDAVKGAFESMDPTRADPPPMDGKTVIVTGGNAGKPPAPGPHPAAAHLCLPRPGMAWHCHARFGERRCRAELFRSHACLAPPTC